MLCARFGRHRWSKKKSRRFHFLLVITVLSQNLHKYPMDCRLIINNLKKNVKGRNFFVVYRSRLSASISVVLSLLSFDVLTILWPGQRCRRPPLACWRPAGIPSRDLLGHSPPLVPVETEPASKNRKGR